MARIEEDQEKVIWVKHYASFHQILIVGDGDFSFSLSLSKSFGSASNIVATSLDSYEELVKKYKGANLNLKQLLGLGACIMHGVDATKMKLYNELKMRKFDRIVFNFPHAGFYGREDNADMIKMHRSLVRGFFHNATGMLWPDGEIHVSHKTSLPFCNWNLEELASQNSLELVECADFIIQDYPGYNNKRGDSKRCDESFPLGDCSTFKFIISRSAMRKFRDHHTQPGAVRAPAHQFSHFPLYEEEFPTSLGLCLPGTDMIVTTTSPSFRDSRSSISLREECFHIFDWYFHHAVEKFGIPDDNIGYNVHKALRHGFERYMDAGSGGTLSGYIVCLEELHGMSVDRIAFLEKKLADGGSKIGRM